MITASLVVYNNDIKKLRQTITSFLNTPVEKKLYIIDNSPYSLLEQDLISISDDIEYLFVGENIGFGAGHNYIINKLSKSNSKHHLILNPDVYFDKETILNLIKKIDTVEAVGMIAPKILYPNGLLQYSIRRFPRPQDLLIRRISLFNKLFKKRYRYAHYLDNNLDLSFYVDSALGCFQLFKTDVFVKINGFDTRYFMYLEDIDICRKLINIGYKTLYFPEANVFHHYEKGSTKSIKLFKSHVISSVKFFLKWRLK